jgi:hypothetical protein
MGKQNSEDAKRRITEMIKWSQVDKDSESICPETGQPITTIRTKLLTEYLFSYMDGNGFIAEDISPQAAELKKRVLAEFKAVKAVTPMVKSEGSDYFFNGKRYFWGKEAQSARSVHIAKTVASQTIKKHPEYEDTVKYIERKLTDRRYNSFTLKDAIEVIYRTGSE